MEELHWYVYIEDFNNEKIKKCDIFNHARFREDVIKAYKNCKDDFKKFSEEVRKSLMYYFWSKYEWEIVLTSWPEKKDFEGKKIDVYSQVMLNWNAFIKYIWDTIKEENNAKK